MYQLCNESTATVQIQKYYNIFVNRIIINDKIFFYEMPYVECGVSYKNALDWQREVWNKKYIKYKKYEIQSTINTKNIKANEIIRICPIPLPRLYLNNSSVNKLP